MKKYDIVIIGGGIAGVYTMYNLKKNYPNLKVLLLEKANRFGGRVYSFHKKLNNQDYIMDLGAGRIGHHHELMVDLIKQLKLESFMYDITNTENYIEYDETTKTSTNKSSLKKQLGRLLSKLFHSLKIKNLKKTQLEKLYLNQLLQKFLSKTTFKNIEKTFEYNNKLYYLNSNDAANYFKYDYTPRSKFFIMTNGMSSIIYKMLAIISQNKNYKFYKNCNVDNISYNIDNNNYIIKSTRITSQNNFEIQATHIVCALPRCDLIKFNILKNYQQQLDTINEISKVRIFEIYNTNNNDVWFKTIPKTTCNTQLQFIIPINPINGLIMSSYNENLSTHKNYWNELYKTSETLLKKKLREKLQEIFNKPIPESKYIKLHYWESGVACWKKNVDSDFVSQQILNLMPNFYICGENYSKYQAWCEGALMTSQQVLEKLNCVLKTQKHNKTIKKRKNRNKLLIN
jgi:hypothetical protein